MSKTNGERAERAETALLAFVEATGDDIRANDLETWISDLLCDLRHLCAAAGVEFNGNAGAMNYEAECEEDPAGDFCPAGDWAGADFDGDNGPDSIVNQMSPEDRAAWAKIGGKAESSPPRRFSADFYTLGTPMDCRCPDHNATGSLEDLARVAQGRLMVITGEAGPDDENNGLGED